MLATHTWWENLKTTSLRSSDSMDSLDSLLPSTPITHYSWQVLWIATSVCIELMDVKFCWLINTGVSICNLTLGSSPGRCVRLSLGIFTDIKSLGFSSITATHLTCEFFYPNSGVLATSDRFHYGSLSNLG